MRKTEILKLIDDGAERTFRITQMPATKAERWANRAAFLLMGAGKEFNSFKKDPKIEDIVKVFSNIDYEKVEPLYNELIECCTYLPDGNVNGAGIGCTQETIDAQIIEPLNLYRLRVAVLKLNFAFFTSVLQFQDHKNDTITFKKTIHK